VRPTILPVVVFGSLLTLAACGANQAAGPQAAVGGASVPSAVQASSSASAVPRNVSLPSGFRDFSFVAYQGEELLGGHEGKFSNLFQSGKPVVLNYWAGSCPPCRAEMPAFQRVADAQQGKVIVFGLDVGPFVQLGRREDAIELYNALHIRYPLAYATNVQPLRLYSVQGMPTTIFFSGSGRIVDKVSGMLSEGQLNAQVQKRLASG